jgi:hypothetical protein
MLGFFTGNNLEATLESAEQGTAGQEIFVNGFRPITDSATVYGSVSWRQALNATPTQGLKSRCRREPATSISAGRHVISASSSAFPTGRVGPLRLGLSLIR